MVVWACSEESGRWSSGIDKDVILLKLLDVSFNLVHFTLNGLFATLLANGIQFSVMRLLLVVAHQSLVFLLQEND